MTPLFRFVGRAMGLFVSALFNGLGLSVPVITRVSPVRGWPGTVLTIDGHRFDDTLDGNVVQIGGDTALVMEASANRLKVLAGEHTASGLIQVATGGTTATAPVSLRFCRGQRSAIRMPRGRRYSSTGRRTARRTWATKTYRCWWCTRAARGPRP